MSRILSWFENRIDPFTGAADVPPPATLAAFYWHFVRQSWPAFALLLVMGGLAGVIEASLFAFVGSLVDSMRTSTSPATFIAEHKTSLVFMAFVAAIARPAVSLAHDLVKHQMIGGAFTTLVRWQSHIYVLRQSLGFFQNDFAGRVSNKVMQAGPAVREGVVQAIDAVWFVAVYWMTAVVLFVQADLRLVGPLILWFMLYVWVLRYFVPRLKARAVASSEARSMLTGRIVDSYTNILTVKLFAHTEREDAYAQDAMGELLARLKDQLRLTTVMETTLFAINGLLLVAMSGLAIWLWSLEAVSIGAIALVMGLTIRIVNMSGWVLWTVAGIFENLGIAHESMETISRPHQVVDRADAIPLEVTNGEIRFEQVSFHYGRERPSRHLPKPTVPPIGDGRGVGSVRTIDSGDAPALSSQGRGEVAIDDAPIHMLRKGGVIENLSLSIRPGEKVGLVGRSGAGKSTLVNILLRFYDLESGRILIDGMDISAVKQESLRSAIGLVTQDTSLLHRSVMDNILYGSPEAGEAAAVAAAKRAHAHDFIVHLEDLSGRTGYAAHVGERGVKLSGGQRQRIAIARVLLKNAPILILDEATSALDSEVEAAIQESLMDLMRGKTVIAIAHRLSTIAAMDRLIVMDKGRIVEEGTHRDLVKRSGLYADLWKRQSGGFLAGEAAE